MSKVLREVLKKGVNGWKVKVCEKQEDVRKGVKMTAGLLSADPGVCLRRSIERWLRVTGIILSLVLCTNMRQCCIVAIRPICYLQSTGSSWRPAVVILK